jgi:1-acyl-sn-glycerol-3-phosphate acyltransferase
MVQLAPNAVVHQSLQPVTLDPISPRLRKWFAKYSAGFLRRHFHTVRLAQPYDVSTLAGWPILLCLNHPSWWDPLFSLHLSTVLFPSRQHHAPIDAESLQKYRFFRRIGFFPVTRDCSGARTFLEYGCSVLSNPNRALWVTAQGQFTDVRIRPVHLQTGIAHLVRHLDRVAVLPLVFEYSFWEEKRPEAFAQLGLPIHVQAGHLNSVQHWTDIFARALEETQDALSSAVQSHDESRMTLLLRGRPGVSLIYDLWRQVRAKVRGEYFNPQHGADD